MLRIIPADELPFHPRLRAGMFRDRARQFRERLGWDVPVDAAGWERDPYDAEGPLYVLWERPDGSHGGSARFLPTLGRTMTEDHFLHLTGGVALKSPLIWECTRFCLAPGSDPAEGARVGALLMLGGAELMRRAALTHLLGVFDAPMTAVYRRLGAEPEVLGTAAGVSVGLWSESPRARDRLLRRAALTPEALDAMLDGPAPALAA